MRALVFALAALAVCAQASPEAAKQSEIPIWPGVAPGSEKAPAQENVSLSEDGRRVISKVARPSLTAFYAAKPNGAAVIVLPAGGYRELYIDSTGTEMARWLNTLGIDAFVLKYRLPNEGHQNGFSVPLQDVQRSLRLVRSGKLSGPAAHAIDPARVGVIGFSAGGHLAAVSGTYFDAKVYEPVDAADAVSARPDFMLLAYAVLPLASEYAKSKSTSETIHLIRTYEPQAGVTAGTPPTFLFVGDKDTDAPPADSESMAAALKKAGVPYELHILADAGHGLGLNEPGSAGTWPALCEAWLRARGIIPAAG